MFQPFEQVSTRLLEGTLVGRGSPARASALPAQETDRGVTAFSRRYGLRNSQRSVECVKNPPPRIAVDQLHQPELQISL